MRGEARSREGGIALALAAAAALRVFVFASAFPFFVNVDEHRHVDAVLKYARGYAPRPGATAYEPAMPSYLGTYGSPEYHTRAETAARRGVPAPPWRRPAAALLDLIEWNRRYLEGRPNLESFQPPAYYAAAGAWLALGRALGLEGGPMLYWVRQLNALTAFALVLASYLLLRSFYPVAAPAVAGAATGVPAGAGVGASAGASEGAPDGMRAPERASGGACERLAVPALLAVFPADVFHCVTPDAFSPLTGGLAFLLLLHVARGPRPSLAVCAGAGAAAALAVLTKLTNAALLPVFALASAALLARPEARRSGAVSRLALAWACFLIPVGLWLARNQLVLGDATGTALKVERLGWQPNPVAAYWRHPLFTPSGLAEFVSQLVPLFWRGEVVWMREVLSSRAADLVYTGTTLLALPLGALGLRRRRRDARLAEGLALVAVLSGVATLMWLSLRFAFPEVGNPSAELPYFFHGRLISGVLVPFAIAYARGIEVAAAALPGRAARAGAWAALGGVAAVALGSELWLARGAFASAYNWFHLP